MKTTILFLFAILHVAQSTLFISEVAEGSSNNKYFEIYNPTGAYVSLDDYGFPTVVNGPNTVGQHDFWDIFTAGATIAPGDVWVVCHPSADAAIQAECDQTHQYLSNGNDALCLAEGDANEYTLLDCVGNFDADPGLGWDVAGVTAATKDHTLVRNSCVHTGNGGDWAASSGTTAQNSEWIVKNNDDWTNLGGHVETEVETEVGRGRGGIATGENDVVKINVEVPAGTEVGEHLYIGGGATGHAQAFQMENIGGIWTVDVTFSVIPGYYTILNSPTHAGDWGAKEDLSGLPCGDPDNHNDRTMTMDDYQRGYKNITFGSCQPSGPCYTDCANLRECYNSDQCGCGSNDPICISYKTKFDADNCCI